MNFKVLSILFIILLSNITLASSNGEDIPAVPVEVTANYIEIDQGNYIVLSYKNYKGWHTYWKNPGDAGLPISFKFKINGVKQELEQLEWPTPKKYIEEGNMLAYGYEKEYSIFFSLPNKLKINDSIKINSNWLVCKHICIPGEIELNAKFNSNKLFLAKDNSLSISNSDILERHNNLPKVISFPTDLDIIMAKSLKGDNLITFYYNINKTKANFKNTQLGLLTPFPLSPFTIKRENLFKDKKGNLYAKMVLEWDGEYQEPEIPFPVDGKFQKPYEFKFLYNNPLTGKVQVIKKSFSSFSLTAAKRMENFFDIVAPKALASGKSTLSDKEELTTVENTAQEKSLIVYLLFAFIGGLILNFMPCVLPVISIKLFGLIKHQNEPRATIFKHNLFYSLGVIFTFMLLALTILGLKSAGESVGWGFQLQSPVFVGSMILILFIFTLNLFGLFEFKTPGGTKLGGLRLEKGYTGDFLSGVLATILSTPCSAPFLGTALTFAFTSGPEMILSIFFAIGIGLSFPFLLTGIFPSMVAFLPKPGMWMENLKKFLGLTLVLTIIWLLDVFTAQIDSSLAILKLNTALALIFFGFYMANKITKHKVFYIPVFLLALFLSYSALSTKVDSIASDNSTMAQEKSVHGLNWEKWSEKKMNDYKASGDVVFIDFTAKWCFTCKVNEKLVLSTFGFRELVKKSNVKLLLADWTKRDAIIGNWLRSKGLVGVPAYFIIDSKGQLHNLGETITLSEIEEKLK